MDAIRRTDRESETTSAAEEGDNYIVHVCDHEINNTIKIGNEIEKTYEIWADTNLT